MPVRSRQRLFQSESSPISAIQKTMELPKQLWAGIDPGQSGGIAVVNRTRTFACCWKMGETFSDTKAILQEIRNNTVFLAFELVHSMPKQGVASSFTFGKNTGFIIGLLVALEIPYQEVTPQTWQKELNCRSHGDKNITKARAQSLFPRLYLTHATADAMLLAEYSRRKFRP